MQIRVVNLLRIWVVNLTGLEGSTSRHLGGQHKRHFRDQVRRNIQENKNSKNKVEHLASLCIFSSSKLFNHKCEYQMKLSEATIEHTVQIILDKYHFPVQFIKKMIVEFNLKDCEDTICNRNASVEKKNKAPLQGDLFSEALEVPASKKAAKVNELSNEEKMKLILGSVGSLLFTGSGKINVECRQRIIDKWTDSEINRQFEKRINAQGNSRAHKVGKLAKQRWHSGKSWANTFVAISGFDKVFTGLANDGKKSKYVDIDPVVKLPSLMDFQIQLKEQLIETLTQKGDAAKCMISLPTGGGKTRTAVEAFVEWLRPRFANGKYLIWLTQSEELCEQAIESITQVWSSTEFTESLRVYRHFGSNDFTLDDLQGGVLVCTIHKIYNAVIADSELADEIISKCGAMIIDEAHRATSDMYQKLYEYASNKNGPNLFPICGLTATPGRTIDTKALSQLFQYNLCTPNLGEDFERDPLKYFRDNRYLANPIHRIVLTHINVTTGDDVPQLDILDKAKVQLMKEELEQYFKKTLNKKLAKEPQRNKLILQTLREIPADQLTIVYACTIEHAQYLSSIMNYYRRSSVVVSSETRKPLRRKYVEQFKKGEIKFIFNYGVLTTGFDAPKTENIVICRPTFSDVLYEQIVGRGLRGPKFGGTPFCTIIDFCDNFLRFGDQQAYLRYSGFWVREETIG